MSNFEIALAIVGGAFLLKQMGYSLNDSSPIYDQSPPTTGGIVPTTGDPNDPDSPLNWTTVDDAVSALSRADEKLAAVLGGVGDEEPDWLIEADYPDWLFLRQMWLPASRIPLTSLTGVDFALAGVFLGIDPRIPALPKGGAGGCPITKTEASIRSVNDQFEKEASAAGGVGGILNIVADIFGVDTKQFDKEYGLGRAATEVRKAKFDVSALSGMRVSDLRGAFSHETKLQRPKGDHFFELRRRADGTLDQSQTTWATVQGRREQVNVYTTIYKDGLNRLLSTPSDAEGFDPKGNINAYPNFAVYPNRGPFFRAGLFQLEKLSNKPSPGTIDHTSSYSDVGEFALPWNTPLLSCKLPPRVRHYARARLYRTLDYLACQMYPVTLPGGSYDPAKLLEATRPQPAPLATAPQLFWYRLADGTKIHGSVFPPHPSDSKDVAPAYPYLNANTTPVAGSGVTIAGPGAGNLTPRVVTTTPTGNGAPTTTLSVSGAAPAVGRPVSGAAPTTGVFKASPVLKPSALAGKVNSAVLTSLKGKE